MAATTENCTAPCHRSPLLPWLLDKPVDGEGEEVVEEDEDAEAEEQEVDDHLATASPRRLCWRGFAFPESLGSTGSVRLQRRRILDILYLSTHTLKQTKFLFLWIREKKLNTRFIHSHTQHTH